MSPSATILHGDCLDVLRTLPDGSVDAVVTDPPYGLNFMGKEWDSPARMLGQLATDNDPRTFQAWSEQWARECLRVLKPGGHLLAFGGTRTAHRLACAIEDAGFEIRDSIAWLYGSGFPKSMNVGKAIDKQKANRDEVLTFTGWVASARDAAGKTNRDIDDAFGFAGMAGHWTSTKSQPSVPTLEQIPKLLDVLEVEEMPAEIQALALSLNGQKGKPGPNWSKRDVVGTVDGTLLAVAPGEGRDRSAVELDITAPATDAAAQWDGWGTALKPAHEPIVVARKPLIGTVAANVLEHGTGALNIDVSRIGTEGGRRGLIEVPSSDDTVVAYSPGLNGRMSAREPGLGRWPANVILDEHQATELDKQSGETTSRKGKPRGAAPGEGWRMTATGAEYGDSGGASRFFYCAKAPSKERPEVSGVKHPTVKPLTLMRYLVRLVTPPGGTVLEPFAGSGATVEAALLEGFDVIAIEREADYLPLIAKRVDRATA